MAHLIRIIMLLLALLAGTISTQASAEAAASAFTQGDYAEAIAQYEALLAEGARDGALYYNLATAYRLADDNARALLNYRRAAHYLPRDADVHIGIALTRNLQNETETPNTNGIINLGTLTNDSFTLGELGLLAWLCWLLLCSLLALAIRWRQGRIGLRWAILSVAGVLLLLITLYSTRYVVETRWPAAVVLATDARAMSGPGDDYRPLFDVPNATEVRILTQQDEWARVQTEAGREGWLPTATIEQVLQP